MERTPESNDDSLSARLEHYHRNLVEPLHQQNMEARRAHALNAHFGNVSPDVRGYTEDKLEEIFWDPTVEIIDDTLTVAEGQ